MLDSVGCRQISTKAVAEKYEFLDPHSNPPFFQVLHKEVFICFPIVREVYPGAPPIPWKVDSIHSARMVELIVVFVVLRDAAAKAMNHDKGCGLFRRGRGWFQQNSVDEYIGVH